MADSPGSDRLAGWKEIAVYLRKSVRAAQRWERDMGLPVHRVRTPNGQSIYARKSEIDDWLKRGDEERRSELSRRAETPPRWWRRVGSLGLAAAALLAIALAISAIVYFFRASATAREPVKFSVSGRVLHALDDQQNEVWRYTFDEAPQRLDTRDRPHLAEPIRRADVDGDGADEVLALVRPRDGPDGVPDESLYCWRLDGTLRWKYTARLSLTFGARTFSGPWRILDYVVAPRTRRVWLALSPDIWWGAAIVGVDARGEGRLQFAHGGLLYTLIYTEREQRRYLLASGVNNAAGQAAVAAIDLDGPPASWPQRPGSEFTCTNCPRGRPAAYLLLPRTEVNRASVLPYNVARVMTLSTDALQVDTEESDDGVAHAIFRIERGLRELSFTPGDGYWSTHRRFHEEGRLNHRPRECREMTRALAGRWWTPETGWQDVLFTPAARAVPASEPF